MRSGRRLDWLLKTTNDRECFVWVDSSGWFSAGDSDHWLSLLLHSRLLSASRHTAARSRWHTTRALSLTTHTPFPQSSISHFINWLSFKSCLFSQRHHQTDDVTTWTILFLSVIYYNWQYAVIYTIFHTVNCFYKGEIDPCFSLNRILLWFTLRNLKDKISGKCKTKFYFKGSSELKWIQIHSFRKTGFYHFYSKSTLYIYITLIL